MSELNTTPAPTPETDKATVTTDWMTGKPVVPADFARRLERERDEAREREKSLLLRLGQEKDHSEHVMARLNDSDTLRLAMFADLTTLRARVAELEAATALTPSHLLDELADLRRDRERLAGVARRQYWALREGDNIVRHIRSTIFPGWTNLSDHDVNACLREYESEHGIDANYVKRNAARAKDAKTEGGV